MELGRYDEVMPLLQRQGDSNSPIVLCMYHFSCVTNNNAFVGNVTLMDFIKYGPDHKNTKKALADAVRIHPEALYVIIGK